jgi:DNA-binding transcriptional MerR regulator
MSTSLSSNTDNREYGIGEVTRLTGLSADTLRYYEKIKLLPPVRRSASGMRSYDEQDLSRLRFIQRAKTMNFSLEEIARLLEMRADPQHVRDEVRELTHRKLAAVEHQLQELDTLRRELTLLVNLCRGAQDGCPIIDDLDSRDAKK